MRLTAVLAMTVGVVGVTAGVAGASQVPSTLTSTATSNSASGWVYFPVGYQLANAHTYETAGAKAADGSCVVSNSESGDEADLATVTVETGLNPATCAVRYTTGTTSVAAATAGGSSIVGGASVISSSSGTTASTAAAPKTLTPAALVYTNYTSYHENQWLDPFGIQVAAQEQWVNWTVRSGIPYTTCVTSYNQRVQWDWYTADGWSLHENGDPVYSDCNVAENYPHSHMSNGVFCVGTTTDAYFGYNTSKAIVGDYLRGNSNGTYTVTYLDWVQGKCSGLLHHGSVSHT